MEEEPKFGVLENLQANESGGKIINYREKK
jgi:hypothetical protein